MRRFCIALILLSMLLSACQSADPDSATFYYCRDPQQYQYFEDNSVICSESRNLTGHRSDLQYMAGLYLAGPMEEGLQAPFAKGTRLLSIRKEDASIFVELSDLTGMLTDAEFTLSAGCFAMTCMDFVQCDDVTIISGDREITLNRENIVLLDTPPQQETTGG